MNVERAPARAPAAYVSGYTPEVEPVVPAPVVVTVVTAVTVVPAPAPAVAFEPVAPVSYFVAAPPESAPVAQPVIRPEPAHVALDTGRTGLPKVQSFELPLGDLAQIAENSGLQWVNSDAKRIASAQQAMASEVQPVRVPRERPPVVIAQDSDLKLVETRRDLTSVVLPFEHSSEGATRNS